MNLSTRGIALVARAAHSLSILLCRVAPLGMGSPPHHVFRIDIAHVLDFLVDLGGERDSLDASRAIAASWTGDLVATVWCAFLAASRVPVVEALLVLIAAIVDAIVLAAPIWFVVERHHNDPAVGRPTLREPVDQSCFHRRVVVALIVKQYRCEFWFWSQLFLKS